MSQRIAVVGAGISGLTAAWYLSRDHQVEVFESNVSLGGHTCTVPVSRRHGDYAIDVGFIVFNDHTYPHFLQLLDELGIGRRPTSMGFAVSDQARGLEYCGDGLGGLFAQKRNLFRPRHWRLIGDILRFNQQAPRLLETQEGDMPLGEYLQRHGYSDIFKRDYILAMGGAIWSCSQAQMASFPARFFVQFFHNHGLLSLHDRPQWYVVPGGSKAYVDAITAGCDATFHKGSPVQRIRRSADGAVLTVNQTEKHFDQVILACHSDQALALLDDPDERERNGLARLPYQDNDVVLHTDTRLLPRRRRVWSSWNALLSADRQERVQVSYNMNILQHIVAAETFCVTLNASDQIDPGKIIARYRFAHPVFTPASMAARETLLAENGQRRTWFAGAWCGNGFHEDGVVSALNIVRALERES